ncbi:MULTISPECIES: DUF4019 domain-containing protein [Gammaproteobacteria]|uniref:DUF4019 domain-containing protein n=1 Tax=Gammaproteobacteria TaxID=1236 RepID=UPI00112DC0B9|nr:DUF4019 domain-containing protein [Pseudomonas sp. Hp2]
MKRFFSTIGIVLLLATGAAAAQQPQAQANRPIPGAIEPNAVRDAGLRVVTVVDSGQPAQLWNEASSVTKKSVARDAFVAGINKSRQPLGKVVSRNWLSVRRQSGDGKALPAGLYASAEFLTEFAGKPPVRELVSFRLDEDGAWRFSGYAVQP